MTSASNHRRCSDPPPSSPPPPFLLPHTAATTAGYGDRQAALPGGAWLAGIQKLEMPNLLLTNSLGVLKAAVSLKALGIFNSDYNPAWAPEAMVDSILCTLPTVQEICVIARSG